MTTNDDNATTWRDLTDQLTPEQIARLESMEQKWPQSGRSGKAAASIMLQHARDHARQNLQFGEVPTPAGAQAVEHWKDDGAGNWSRRFNGSKRMIAKVGADVVGVQHPDGSAQRRVSVSVYANGEELTSGQARELAAALIAAADELDHLV